MPVIGTAGHVDHGKSTLVRALTGLETDRWDEERRRGLTIDLGFAWTRLPSGAEVSFVDVPGHETFIKNMLSGIEAIDVALLVVAADEGWMPQTEEHVAVLDLLGIERAVVAISKIDRVDEELAELAALEVRDHLEGTTIEGSRLVMVSATDGSGIDDLFGVLDHLVAAVPTIDTGRPRLWVDRSFSVAGAGTVVTGTLLDGSVAVDDRLAVFPGARPTRVRGLQSHEQERSSIGPQTRAALNLGGVERGELDRGTMIGRADQWEPTGRFLASIRSARYAEPIGDRGAHHLHVGSGAWSARVVPIGDGLAVVDLPVPLTLTMGDRFIIRDTGRRLVVAGGRVLDPAPPDGDRAALRRIGAALARVADDHPDVRAETLLEIRGQERTTALSAHTGGGTAGIEAPGGTAMSSTWASDVAGRARDQLADFHGENPLRPGMPLATLASALRLDPDVVARALESEAADIIIETSTVRLSTFTVELSPDQRRAIDDALRTLDQAGWAVPRTSELELDAELLHMLLREGRLVRVSDDFVYPPSLAVRLSEGIADLEQPFTVSEFKDHLGLSRKHAVPLLEWADSVNLTRRSGERRALRRDGLGDD